MEPIECPSCGHQFTTKEMEAEEAHEAPAEEVAESSPEEKPHSFTEALKRRMK